MSQKRTLDIYTDGGCRPNPGIGACAFAVVDPATDTCTFDWAASDPETTNNRMELSAMIGALRHAGAHPETQFRVLTDSQYTRQGLLSWVHTWVRNGWVSSKGSAVLNRDLWQKLHALHQQADNVELVWVKGHAGNKWNEHVDGLCTSRMLEVA